MLSAYFEHKSLLHKVLRLNAAFSGVFGLVFILFPAKISGMLGLSNDLTITITGMLLIGWEIFAFHLVQQPQVSVPGVWIVILGDLAWVVGSIALLVGAWLPLTTTGFWFVAIIADIVLVFSIVQYFGLRRQRNLN